MNWVSWFNWFNREKITLLVAALTLFLGAISPWYRLPPEALDQFGTTLFWANSARIIAAIFACLCLVLAIWQKPRRVPRLLFWQGLIFTLIFPYLVTTWSPTVAFLAAAYQSQVEQVTQHIEGNFSEIQAQWKQNILLGSPILTQSTFPRIEDTRFFQLPSIDWLIREGLGYKNSFLSFIGRGWSFTVIGLAIALMAIYLGLNKTKFTFFVGDVYKLLIFASLGLGFFLSSVVIANVIDHRIDTAFSRGNYQQAVEISRKLTAWYPTVNGDETFLKRFAEAEHYGDESEPALILFAKGLERYQRGDWTEAKEAFQQSLSLQPDRFLVRDYLATTLLKQGVEFFNNRLHGAAADRFEETLQFFPNHIVALYDLMLARTANGEFEKSETIAQQLIQLQQYFQFSNRALIGQAYLHSSWASYHSDNPAESWREYKRSIGDKP